MMAASEQAATATAVPPGYAPLQAPPGFVREIGGVHVHVKRPLIAIRVKGEHLNSIRIAHGGFLATLADTAFGVVLRRDLALPASPATVTLNIDYLAAVREGDWLEAHVEVQKVGRQLTNASCLLKVADRLVLRATGIFIMPSPRQG